MLAMYDYLHTVVGEVDREGTQDPYIPHLKKGQKPIYHAFYMKHYE
jgi:hypothetical protein